MITAPEPAQGNAESVKATLEGLHIDTKVGLTVDEVAQRRHRYGENSLDERGTSALMKFLSFFWGPIPWMIEVAAILSAVVQHWADLAIIVAMLLINAAVGFWQEYKADNAISTLKQRLALRAKVLRDGEWKDLSAKELVPGDVIKVALGNIIPADVLLVEGKYLSVDQSALSGESLPVDKVVGDSAYSGSIARQGEMKAVVTATGMSTYFGKTARLVQDAKTTSHFQRAVLGIGNFLILVTIALVGLILVVALFRHDPFLETVQFALILTVAAIPVALPAVLSVTMAVGAERLAKMQAVVSRLVAIEEMAGVDVLCTDKTGTLTQNQLTVADPELIHARDDGELLLMAALASETATDDPIDRAISEALQDGEKLERNTIVDFEPFDPVSKRAIARVQADGVTFQVAKGAPQAILDLVEPDDGERRAIVDRIDSLAAQGYRTLGVARSDRASAGWSYLGLLPLYDPPREDTAATIAEATRRGINIKMVTGDHLSIARQVAAQLHLGQRILPANELFRKDGSQRHDKEMDWVDGYAQVFPEHKYSIVRALQKEGHIVGMTGDGVNDAPALKQADVGIAVSGATDAARVAADLVLTAPGLSVITQAVDEARRIFERMNTYAVYRIAETVRVLLFMTLAILVFDFYPVTAVMIILLALLNDFPIMTVAYDNASTADRPVRWEMPRVLAIAALLGILGVFSSFGLFWIARVYMQLPQGTVQTLIFLKLLVAGHLTIYLTRNRGAIWETPLPSWQLFVTTQATKVLGTLAAVYGWFVAPIGWKYALMVWGYALVWFFVNSFTKVVAYRLLEHTHRHHSNHLARVEAVLHPNS
jgi:H+-transporting ATPase